MGNLSQEKRARMAAFLRALKEAHREEDGALAALSEIETELFAKKYGLVWEEHEEAVDVMMRENVPVFTECKEKEIAAAKSEDVHFLLEGDNLHSLKLLEKTHKGKVDVIYIDPPYNKRNKDFIYDDAFIDTDDGFRHSKWLSFMKERLDIADALLAEGGYIFISIDDNEVAPLILLCDEIFGENNHVNTITINMNSLSGVKMTHAIKGKRYPAQKEYMLLYKKGNIPANLFIDKIHKDKWDKEYNLIIPEMKEGQFESFEELSATQVNSILADMHLESLTEFIKTNKIKKTENWLWENSYRIFGTKSNRPLVKQIKDKTFPQQIMCYSNNDGNNRYFRSDFNRDTRDPRIELVRAESNSSVFLSDNWTDISNDGGVAQEGGVTFPNGKKPLSLIIRVLEAANKKNAVVLDFFAGSGTTGHAVLELNKRDGGRRKFILCTNNENGICENVTYPRIRTVITGKRADGSVYSEGIPANVKYFRTDFVSKMEEDLSAALLSHIAEMVELEHGVKLDGRRYLLVLSDEEADELATHWEAYPDVRALYVSREVLFTTEQTALFSGVEVHIIPDSYFQFELREAGESW